MEYYYDKWYVVLEIGVSNSYIKPPCLLFMCIYYAVGINIFNYEKDENKSKPIAFRIEGSQWTGHEIGAIDLNFM